MSGPYYNTPPGQPHINAPSGFSPAHTSTFQQSADVGRKSKRYYPQLPSQVSPVAQPSVYHQPTHPVSQQQTPQQTTPIYQDSTYTSPVPQKATYDTNYNQTLTGMANMNVYSGVPPSTAREDVSLIGQPPLVQDLHRKPPAIRLPPNVILKSVYSALLILTCTHTIRCLLQIPLLFK